MLLSLTSQKFVRSVHHVVITAVTKLAFGHRAMTKFIPSFVTIGQMLSEFEMVHAQTA
jgi:hypothetical protein